MVRGKNVINMRALLNVCSSMLTNTDLVRGISSVLTKGSTCENGLGNKKKNANSSSVDLLGFLNVILHFLVLEDPAPLLSMLNGLEKKKLKKGVDLFHPNAISETTLRRLLKQDIVCHIKKNKEWRTDPATIIYQQGKAADYFVLILEGRVEVTVGRENLMFVGGPFTYFGTQALVQTVGVAESPSVPTPTLGSLESLNLDSMLKHTFLPDYTVRASTEVLYLKIKRSLYLAAKRATLMERSQRDHNQTAEQFDEEVDKLLHSFGDDDVSMGHATPRKRSSKTLQHSELNALTYAGSPKHSLQSGMSPPSRVSPKDVNGSIKASIEESGTNDEDAALLPSKRS